jgi:superfamily I DNA/RNA helicase
VTSLSLVVGQAGTGKTTWLMEKVREKGPGLISSEHQRLLAITRMHGARRRVQTKLRECAPGIRCSVSTIDGFALSILNRWRTVLGWSKPIQSVSTEADFGETLFAIEADFERVRAAATRLLQYTTVKHIINATYPLIAVDEFQDCHGSLLEFIKALSSCSTLLLAADDFQLLDTSVSGCPAVEWAKELRTDQRAEITELTACHRTSTQGILEAARCLRENIQATETTVPVICCPREEPMAWKMIEKLVFNTKPWTGTTALICPSHDPFIQKVLNSCNAQLQKRNCRPIHWDVEYSTKEEQDKIRESLGLAETRGKTEGQWVQPNMPLDPIGAHVVARSQRFARLKGLKSIPRLLLEQHVDSLVHERRAYRDYNPLRAVMTVHGAKNREFDNVFVVWTYKLPPDKDQQRRLLYNAVTRAQNNCTILVWGSLARAQTDSTLRLLGPAQPAFSNQTNPKSKSSKTRKQKDET